MKKHLLALAFATGLFGTATAQVCSYYPNPCAIVSPNPGCFNPSPMEVEAGVAMGTGVNTGDLIQFKLLTQVSAPPLGNVTIQKIKVTDIQNVPAGLSWVSGTADSTFFPDPTNMPGFGPVGCIKIVGTPTTRNTINDSITYVVNVTVLAFGAPIICCEIERRSNGFIRQPLVLIKPLLLLSISQHIQTQLPVKLPFLTLCQNLKMLPSVSLT